jgi:predicted transcriptional regulator
MIDNVTDSNVLFAVQTLLAATTPKEKDWWETISNDERREIDQGLSEAENGGVIAHDKVMEQYKKWL